MRILFFEDHPIWKYGLPNGFKDLGHEVVTTGAEASLQTNYQIIKNYKPHLIFTIGWTPSNDSKQIRAFIRKITHELEIPHIYWATEDLTYTLQYSLPYVKATEPDFIFTVSNERVPFYQAQGFKAAHLDFGYHPAVNFPTKADKRMLSTLAVVANGYSNRLDEYPNHFRHKSLDILIKPLLKAGYRIDFWGWGWDKMKDLLEYDIPKQWLHGYLDYSKANAVYSSADIVLGLQNYTTQLTMRTYEILGSGAFLLTVDTPAVKEFFTPGIDLVVSSSPEETLRQVNYYLKNPQKRDVIKKQGHSTVNKFSYKNRARHILKVLREAHFLNHIN